MSELQKCTIVSVDLSPKIEVVAHYNPKEISIDKSVPWNKHKNAKGDNPMLEFTNAENRTLSLELFFDAYEIKGGSVLDKVKELTELTLINKDAKSEEEKHPTRVLVLWGAFPKFLGVIESMGTKYTMFRADGTPVRATCTLKIKEVDTVQAKEKEQ